MMPLLHFATLGTLMVLAGYVAFGSLCRVNYLYFFSHQPAWIVVFLSMAGLGASVLLQFLKLGLEPTLPEAFALLAAALYLRLSKRNWPGAAPRAMERS